MPKNLPNLLGPRFSSRHTATRPAWATRPADFFWRLKLQKLRVWHTKRFSKMTLLELLLDATHNTALSES